jgi:hypothetical protein
MSQDSAARAWGAVPEVLEALVAEQGLEVGCQLSVR